MRRRLAHVARHVGVSEATVSRVLNQRPGVAESTRQAVLTALDVLGYERPTQLRGERARLVGLVLPELQNPIFPAVADVVGGALAQQGCTPVLCTRTVGGFTEAAYVYIMLYPNWRDSVINESVRMAGEIQAIEDTQPVSWYFQQALGKELMLDPDVRKRGEPMNQKEMKKRMTWSSELMNELATKGIR